MRNVAPKIISLLASLVLPVNCFAQEPAPPASAGNPPANSSAVTESGAEAASHPGATGVRIVRLSEVKGDVHLDRGTDRGFEMAFANLPIARGQRLETKQGVAEVEFEDNSTLRLTPDSLIEFSELGRDGAGATISTVRVLKGTMYVSMTSTKGNQFHVAFAKQTVVLPPSSHVRLFVGEPASRLAVLSGSVQLESLAGTQTLAKGKLMSFDPVAGEPVVASNKETAPFDAWDKSSAEYHNLRSVPASYGGGSSLFGLNDMNYYGSFSNMGSCGSMWRPYLASAAFDPFANGVWAYYPGAGYSWVSPYPWGWTPYHTGSWNYCASAGAWGWQPGGSFTGLGNQQLLLRSLHPLKPPSAPVPGHGTLFAVNMHPLVASRQTSTETFTFHPESAGLGVPRGAVSNLGKVSTGVAQHGPISMTLPTSTSSMQNGHAPGNTSSSYTGGAGHTTAMTGSSAASHSSGPTMSSSPASSSSSSHH